MSEAIKDAPAQDWAEKATRLHCISLGYRHHHPDECAHPKDCPVCPIFALALSDAARTRDTGPGTPEARLTALNEFTKREFGHDGFSSKPFEVTLYEGIKKLREQISDAARTGRNNGLIEAFAAGGEECPSKAHQMGCHFVVQSKIAALRWKEPK